MSSESLQELNVSPNKVIDATISVQTEHSKTKTGTELSSKLILNQEV